MMSSQGKSKDELIAIIKDYLPNVDRQAVAMLQNQEDSMIETVANALISKRGFSSIVNQSSYLTGIIRRTAEKNDTTPSSDSTGGVLLRRPPKEQIKLPDGRLDAIRMIIGVVDGLDKRAMNLLYEADYDVAYELYDNLLVRKGSLLKNPSSYITNKIRRLTEKKAYNESAASLEKSVLVPDKEKGFMGPQDNQISKNQTEQSSSDGYTRQSFKIPSEKVNCIGKERALKRPSSASLAEENIDKTNVLFYPLSCRKSPMKLTNKTWGPTKKADVEPTSYSDSDIRYHIDTKEYYKKDNESFSFYSVSPRTLLFGHGDVPDLQNSESINQFQFQENCSISSDQSEQSYGSDTSFFSMKSNFSDEKE